MYCARRWHEVLKGLRRQWCLSFGSVLFLSFLKRLLEGAKRLEPFSLGSARRENRSLKIDGHRKVNLLFRILAMRQEARMTLCLIDLVQLLLTFV